MPTPQPTHKCKFDDDKAKAKLPDCPLKYRLCHSPCDLLSRVVTSRYGTLAIVVVAPDGLYSHGEMRGA